MAAMSATTVPDIVGALERRRRVAAEGWNLGEELVLIGAGAPVPVPGRGDRLYPFRAHSEYLYLTDRERPDGVLAFDPHAGWSDFVVPVSREETVWEGIDPAAVQGEPIGELDGWLRARAGRRIGCLGAPIAGVRADAALSLELRRTLNAVRRPKDGVELERMRRAQTATAQGFAALLEHLEPGVSERELAIELETAFRRAGTRDLAFESIVAGGPNSAVLHFPPTGRRVAAGELVLVDSGAEYRAYCADVTRTYPVGGTVASELDELHATVRAACRASIELCVAGTEWTEVHRCAALVIAEGLVAVGLLRGEPESLFESGAVAVFFPHGVGHMVGLGARDASEILPGRRPDPLIFPSLRMDLPLEPGYVVTVEPGAYLVPALLHDSDVRARHARTVDWDRAEAMIGRGGVRIEEDVLVTDGAPEVLSAAIPITPPG